jgi:MerR family mercuric resistance operon transcriptional regulator
MSEPLRSGAVARAAGVNLETLRYYERRGLLAEPQRSPGGHRLYPTEAVTLVRVIKAAQRLGFTLDEVAELLQLRRPGRSTAGLQTRVDEKLAEVEARIADLQLIGETLRSARAAGCDDLIACSHEPLCPIPFDSLAGQV